MKLSTSTKCSYCDKEDYIEHFFFQCAMVQKLWYEVQKDIQASLDVTLKITEAHVLCGVTNLQGVSKSKLKQINRYIGIGRLTVSKFRYGKKGIFWKFMKQIKD